MVPSAVFFIVVCDFGISIKLNVIYIDNSIISYTNVIILNLIIKLHTIKNYLHVKL